MHSRAPARRAQARARRAGGGRGDASRDDTLTVTDNRTGQTYELADHGRHRPRHGPPPDQGRRRRLRPDDLRPGVHEHRVVPLGDHLHRRRRGHPRVPRLPDRAARRAVDLPRGRLPARPRRAADPERSSTSGSHEITIHTFVHENVKDFMQGFRYDAHPMGMLLGVGRRAVDLLPGRQGHPRRAEPPHPDDPADREDADARGVRLPALAGPAVRLSRQRPAATRATSSR